MKLLSAPSGLRALITFGIVFGELVSSTVPIKFRVRARYGDEAHQILQIQFPDCYVGSVREV